jgi:hypothetical protein
MLARKWIEEDGDHKKILPDVEVLPNTRVHIVADSWVDKSGYKSKNNHLQTKEIHLLCS